MRAALPDLSGQSQALSQWKGKVLVVNFWATWCAPCREEIPALIEVQEKLGPSGLQIIGIAIDQAERVKPYAAQMRMNYPVLVGELDAMDLAQKTGNQLGGLPFTVIVDRSGDPVRTELGALDQKKLYEILQPLL
jgi:thiol-disulfide isomerase/thioredoxin